VKGQAVLRVGRWDAVQPRFCPLVQGEIVRDCEALVGKQREKCATDMDLGQDNDDELKSTTEARASLATSHQVGDLGTRRWLIVETGDLGRFVRVTSKGNHDDDDNHDDTWSGYVVLVIHHIITDGIGGLEFFSELVQRTVRHGRDQHPGRG
jgi:hypothetical protein